MTQLSESPSPAPTDAPSATPDAGRAGLLARVDVERWSLPAVFVATIIIFSVARPEVFPTFDNAVSILHLNLPQLVVLGGLCVVLAMREFDLSFAFVAGASGALSVQAMASWDLGALPAIALGVGLGAILGLVNGVLVAYLNLPSFICTLATGSVIQGLMMAIAGETIFEGITDGYKELTTKEVAGIPIDLVAGAVLLLVLGFLLRFSVFGRHAAAIGDNPAAARIAGIHVQRVKVIGFVLVGACAGLSGIIITSQAGQYYPNPAASLLLSAYAAAFLSLSLGRGWRFNIGGAVLGSVFLACVTTGVTMLNQPAWLAQLLQGLILLIAIVALSRRQVAR